MAGDRLEDSIDDFIAAMEHKLDMARQQDETAGVARASLATVNIANINNQPLVGGGGGGGGGGNTYDHAQPRGGGGQQGYNTLAGARNGNAVRQASSSAYICCMV